MRVKVTGNLYRVMFMEGNGISKTPDISYYSIYIFIV